MMIPLSNDPLAAAMGFSDDVCPDCGALMKITSNGRSTICLNACALSPVARATMNLGLSMAAKRVDAVERRIHRPPSSRATTVHEEYHALLERLYDACRDVVFGSALGETDDELAERLVNATRAVWAWRNDVVTEGKDDL